MVIERSGALTHLFPPLALVFVAALIVERAEAVVDIVLREKREKRHRKWIAATPPNPLHIPVDRSRRNALPQAILPSSQPGVWGC